jgi:signal-transduction protein with cAMP-binding, CBS, and nucleotidyltransferase domain
MRTGVTVADAMTEKPITVTPAMTVQECAQLMTRKKVGSVVVQERGNFVGILTERDITRKVVAEGLSARKKVKDAMSIEMLTIEPDKDIFDALALMRDADVRHLPVVSDGRLLGLVTMKDVLKIEPDLFDILVQKFDLREETRKPVNRITEGEGVCQSCGNYSDDLQLRDGSLVCDECKAS